MELKFYRQILYFADKNIAIYERSRSNHAQPIVILPKIDKIKSSVLCKITSYIKMVVMKVFKKLLKKSVLQKKR